MSTPSNENQPDHDKLPPSGQPAWQQDPSGGTQPPAPQGYTGGEQSPYGAGQPYQPGYTGGPQGYGAPQGYQGYPGGPGGPWTQQDPNAKSRMAAGLLGIFLGYFGVHRFYLGHTGIGVVMLLITVISFGTLIWVSAIWGLIEGILYLTDKTGTYSRDASGRPLRD